jgi:hypothetical protein
MLVFSNATYDFYLNWSSDSGINTDYQDSLSSVINEQTLSIPVRSRWMSFSFNPSVPPQLLRLNISLNQCSPGLFALNNVGSGAEIYKKPTHAVRSIISSDSSITVSELTNEIDLIATGGGGSVTLSSAGGTSLVTDGVGPALEIKGLTTGSYISLTSNVNDISLSLSSLSYGLIKFSNGGGATQTATTTPAPVTVYTYSEPQPLVDFTHAVNGTLVYSGATSKSFIVYGHAAVRPTALTNMFFIGILYQGTTMIDNIPCTVLSTTDQKVPSFYTIITLSTNDSLSVGMFTLSGTQSVSFTKALLSVVEMRS